MSLFFVCQKGGMLGSYPMGVITKVVSARISPAPPRSVLLKGEGISWMGALVVPLVADSFFFRVIFHHIPPREIWVNGAQQPHKWQRPALDDWMSVAS